MKRVIVLGVVCLLLALPALGQTGRSGEIARLQAEIESPLRAQRINAAKIISSSGLQAPELYAKIAALLKEGYPLPFEKDRTDEMAWLCKALAASGDEQYRQLLSEVASRAPSDKLRRYAKQSVELFEQYAQRKDILNKSENWDASLSAEGNRLINMLQSDDLNLRRDAAKTISRDGGDAKVFDVAAQTLKTMAAGPHKDNLSIDTMGWLCKALGASGDSRYAADLQFVNEHTQNEKLRKYVKKALSALR